MTKVMHLDNVFEVFIFLFFIFGYFFCARTGAYLYPSYGGIKHWNSGNIHVAGEHILFVF